MKFSPVVHRGVTCAALGVLSIALFISGKLLFDYYAWCRTGMLLMILSICLGAGTCQCIILVSCIADIRSKFLLALDNPPKKQQRRLSYRGTLILCLVPSIFCLAFGILYFSVLQQLGNSLLNLIFGMSFLVASVQFTLLRNGIEEIISILGKRGRVSGASPKIENINHE